MKKIFLTGASSGIGKAIAAALVEQGHEVWGTSRDVSRLPSLSRFHAVHLDLANTDSIDKAFAAALADAGNFDVLINNAGSGHFGPAEVFRLGYRQPISNPGLRSIAIDASGGCKSDAIGRVDHQRFIFSSTPARSVHGRLQLQKRPWPLSP